MFAIIGTLVVLGSVLGGFAMGGSSLLLLWHPLEIVVIIGAALGAFMISNPMKVIKASFSGALGLVKGARYGRAEYIQLLKLVYDILVMARKDGVLAIERHIEDPAKSDIFKKYPFIMADHHMMEFITDCLRLISGGNLDPHELESLLEYELETHHKESAEPSHAVQKVADALPGFGIVAAVLGIVSTMAAIDGASTSEIGHKVGAALVGTFLGILVAYGFVGPDLDGHGAQGARRGQGLRSGQDGAGGQRARLSAAGGRGVCAQAAVQQRAPELQGSRSRSCVARSPLPADRG